MDTPADNSGGSPTLHNQPSSSRIASSPFPFRQQGPRLDSRLALLQTELQKHAEALERNDFFIVSFAFVLGGGQITTARYRGHSGSSGAPLKLWGETDQSGFRESDLVSKYVPNYVHFRCLVHLPPGVRRPAMSTHPSHFSLHGGEGRDSGSLRSPTQQSGVEDELQGYLASNGAVEDCCSFAELSLLRHVEPSMFSLLELKRLNHFKVSVIPTSSHYIHLYEAVPKVQSDLEGSVIKGVADQDTRYFVRILVRALSCETEQPFAEEERHFVAGLNALELAKRSSRKTPPSLSISGNVIVLSVMLHPRTKPLTPSQLEAEVHKLAKRYESRLSKNSVSTIEVRFHPTGAALSQGEGNTGSNYEALTQRMPLRMVVDNPTGQALRVRSYAEVTNPTTGQLVFSELNPERRNLRDGDSGAGIGNSNSTRPGVDADYDGHRIDKPHPLAGPLDQRRAMAAALSTVYIYDFLGLFEEAVKEQWMKNPKYFVGGDSVSTHVGEATGRGAKMAVDNSRMGLTGMSFLPDRVFEAVEVATNKSGQLEDVERPPGQNTCGMVAWRIKMCTPEFPRGRRAILIGNDATFQTGTFGLPEDLLFQRASEYSRQHGVPRIYIACNSGARMGLATEVQRAFKVEWIDAMLPAQGFKYIYLNEKDYRKLKSTDSIVAERVAHPEKGTIYKITDVIGQNVGIGVENLCGSGAIAGETSRAYNDTFTVTFVTGRTVGIGAYITRLGQRVIQKVGGAPILLTGCQALNRLIGRDVYSSNDEIGGIDVMYRNGISHLTVKDDIEGCQAILDWLSYVPEHRDGPPPIMVDTSDPINRPIQYRPGSNTDDPRMMLTGCKDAQGQWKGGIFDRGTFREVMPEWAKSVIVGRARLGGIPLGVICVETRVTEYCHPADPAVPSTSEIKLNRAGQVWYPDSAFKTAQAIRDISKEELPIMIFANWRGFSGGQRDMFNEVLKFGSYIVDALVDVQQPCFVFIPPKAELRGGAWVCVDPRINSDHMEMYADSDCRGGVLEPTGTVEIKFREKALIECAGRLDSVLSQLVREDTEAADEGVPIDSPQRQDLKQKKEKRLQEILPVYKQIALHFADLHDTAVRMKRRGAVHEVVPWEKSRTYFYWRLRRQLLLYNLRSELRKANPTLSIQEAGVVIAKWAEAGGVGSGSQGFRSSVDLNHQFVQWACNSIRDISTRLQGERRNYLAEKTAEFCRESIDAVIAGVKTVDPQRAKALDGVFTSPGMTRPYESSASIAAFQHITNDPTRPSETRMSGAARSSSTSVLDSKASLGMRKTFQTPESLGVPPASSGSAKSKNEEP